MFRTYKDNIKGSLYLIFHETYVVFRIKVWLGSTQGERTAANHIYTEMWFDRNLYVYIRRKKHDKYVHVVIDTMTSPKNRTNSLLAYNKHLTGDSFRAPL